MNENDHYGNPDTVDFLLMKVSKLFFMYKDPYHLYRSIAYEASDLVGADKCSLMLPDSESRLLRINAIRGMDASLMDRVLVRPGEGIAGRVYETGVPILIDSEERIREYAICPRPQYKTASAISLPLKIADETLGVLNLTDKHSGMPFDPGDLSALDLFAFHATLVLKLSACHANSEKMRELSITDCLTGLFNRRYFNIRIEEEYLRAKRTNNPFSVAIVDIDNFKLYNDTEGHLAGDKILKEVASILNMSIRANDILVRFGGEEFAIIMPQTAETEAFNVAERIRENIKNMIRPLWKMYPGKRITVCAGIASYREGGGSIENLIGKADKALYAAKMNGKDRTVLHEDGSDRSARISR